MASAASIASRCLPARASAFHEASPALACAAAEPEGGLAAALLGTLGTTEIEGDSLAAAGNLRMGAGMPAEVYVRTDSRNAFDYMLAPVTAFLRRGMREPL